MPLGTAARVHPEGLDCPWGKLDATARVRTLLASCFDSFVRWAGLLPCAAELSDGGNMSDEKIARNVLPIQIDRVLV